MSEKNKYYLQQDHNQMFQKDKKTSPRPPPRMKLRSQLTMSDVLKNDGTDSDASGDSNSLSGESGIHEQPKELLQLNTSGKKKVSRRRGSEWEILESLKDGQRFETRPDKFSGYLHKKRKWPLKGWHKRYFVLDKGLLVYAKNPTDIARGKLHGSLDIGLSVISTKEKRKRLDIDAEEFIYHLKAKTIETFNCWVEQLKVHRLYKQHLLTYGTKELPLIRNQTATAILDEIDGPSARNKLPLTPPEVLSREGSLQRNVKSNLFTSGRLTAWLVDSALVLETTSKELSQINATVDQLVQIAEHIEANSTVGSTCDIETLNPEGSSPNVKKDRKKFGLRKKKSSKGSSVDLTSSLNPNPENCSPLSCSSFSGLSTPPQNMPGLSASNNSLTTIVNSSMVANLPLVAAVTRPHSLPGTEHLQAAVSAANVSISSNISERQYLISTPDNQLREDFILLTKSLVSSMKEVLYTLNNERGRLKTAIESEAMNPSNQSSSLGNMVGHLKNCLNQALQQNQEMKTRLAKVHEISDLSELSSIGPASEMMGRHMNSLSYSSSCVSASEFYDAEDVRGFSRQSPTLNAADVENKKYDNANYMESGDIGDLEGETPIPGEGSITSSEAGSITSEEESNSSENSEIGNDYNTGSSMNETSLTALQCTTGRRTKLPVPRRDTEGLSLWNLLCKNIGKDLSQISMPVALNEPLNILQRLCEELEYSELLDKAAELDNPYERMVYIAAFAVSSYAASYFRAGNKPFNPILGETYECIREDKGFRYISEQVSHHPPVSVCHADSRNYIFWQDARIKTKFWGKSMEFQPIGLVNVKLTKTCDHYQWNKVTTCVHNLFSGQRWVDQYGELKITELKSNIVCKLTFVKASYWSAKRHEIYGAITSADGKVAKKLFGKWNEALYCGVAPSARCVWRPGTMPTDYELYYGFTRFAIELNELGAGDTALLPVTDTRLRPDQRALERGDLEAAERLKQELEQMQRERRKREEGVVHEARWFSKHLTEDGEEVWDFKGDYWDVKKSPGFANLNIEPLW